jgi:hypothetical protein
MTDQILYFFNRFSPLAFLLKFDITLYDFFNFLVSFKAKMVENFISKGEVAVFCHHFSILVTTCT